MKQLITRVDESLAKAVKDRAALNGESVNAFVTRLLTDAVADRSTWKRDAIAAGLIMSRPSPTRRPRPVSVTTPPDYASDLVSAERDER